VLCVRACAVSAFLWARFGAAQAERHLAIVDPLLVTRLAAEPLLRGAGRLDVACFAVGARWCRAERSQHHQQEECSRHEADRSTQHHLRQLRIGVMNSCRFT
jgi:hypothetical protein